MFQLYLLNTIIIKYYDFIPNSFIYIKLKWLILVNKWKQLYLHEIANILFYYNNSYNGDEIENTKY